MKKRIPIAFVLAFVSFFSSLAFSASNLNLSTRLSVGTRSGLFAALYSSEDQSPDQDTGLISTQLFLTPEIALAVVSRRVRFETNYRLSLSNQVVRQGQFSLNIHQVAGLGLNTQISRTLYFTANANASMGLVDFSTALHHFGADEEIAANIPHEDRVRFINILASMGLTKHFRSHSSGSISTMYRGSVPIGYEEGDTLPFSRQHQAGLRLVYNRQISRRNSLDSSISGALVVNDPGSEFIPIQLIQGWTYAFKQNSTLRVFAGVVMAHQIRDENGESADDDDNLFTIDETHWLPMGGLSLESTFNLKKRKTLTIGLNSGLSAYFDNVTASISQRVLFGFNSSISWPSTWSLTAGASISTLTTPASAEDGDQAAPPIDYPTTAAVNLSAGYQITEQVQLQFGVSSSARWSPIWETDFRARAFEQFLFTLTLTAAKTFLE